MTSMETILCGIDYGVDVKQHLIERAVNAGYAERVESAVLTESGRKFLDAKIPI